ncbi:hypothetical protein R3P38DRAFT_2809441 [Favolaschia claudopus]|uniref:Uncharacterized protein n=1 Tax=Favolaschia claudopus TaxID=2862362 RepID=A0AAV9ZCJ9_9AGAR
MVGIASVGLNALPAMTLCLHRSRITIPCGRNGGWLSILALDNPCQDCDDEQHPEVSLHIVSKGTQVSPDAYHDTLAFALSSTVPTHTQRTWFCWAARILRHAFSSSYDMHSRTLELASVAPPSPDPLLLVSASTNFIRRPSPCLQTGISTPEFPRALRDSLFATQNGARINTMTGSPHCGGSVYPSQSSTGLVGYQYWSVHLFFTVIEWSFGGGGLRLFAGCLTPRSVGMIYHWTGNDRDGSLRCIVDTRIVANIIADGPERMPSIGLLNVRRRRFESVTVIRPVECVGQGTSFLLALPVRSSYWGVTCREDG